MSESSTKKPGRNRKLLVLVLILPVFLVVGREIARGELVAGMRAVDFADMILLAPLYAAVLIYLWGYMWKHESPQLLLVAFAVFGILFMYGHSMHVTGNAINTFATEIRDYGEIIPDDLYRLIYFFDEQLSHALLFVATTGLLACWLIFDRLALAPPILPQNVVLIVTLGVLWGIVEAYGHIEAQTVWLMFPIVIVLMSLWLYLWRKSAMQLRRFFWDRPFTTFVVIMLIVGFLTLMAWGIFYDGFPQPSEIGL
ncbi:MAG TPA: hypothetical protein VFI27_02835 [candidate division Zixibacteria bacterium]|nr:hypothetical protein [candidate division Zixibacteria bacterium]